MTTLRALGIRRTGDECLMEAEGEEIVSIATRHGEVRGELWQDGAGRPTLCLYLGPEGTAGQVNVTLPWRGVLLIVEELEAVPDAAG